MPVVETIFTATDETGPALSSARNGAIGLRREIEDTTGAYGSYEDQLRSNASAIRDNTRIGRLNTQAFRQEHEVLFTSIDLASSVGQSFLRLTHIFTAYNTMQLRVQDQEERVANAQEATRDAAARYGASSRQAIEAKRREIIETEKLNRVNQEAQIQMIANSVAALSVVSGFGRVAQQANKLRFAVGQRGGLSEVLGLGGAPLAAGLPPLGGTGGRGFLSRIGGVRGAAGIGAGALGAAIIANAALNPAQTQGDKLATTLGTAGSFGLSGALLGSVVPGLGTLVGGAIGAGAGLGAGLFQNFGEEFANLFAGKGFTTNAALDVNVNVNTAPGVVASASVAADNMLRVRSAIAGQVG
jgi:hypothetical protein